MELQTSDWSAPNLSEPQLSYAAADAVLAFHLARMLMPRLAAEHMAEHFDKSVKALVDAGIA